MKKHYLFLLFFSCFINAQIVNIPDANFKAKLVSATSSNYANNYVAYVLSPDGTQYFQVAIDTNGDGEIQNSEALIIDYLDVSIHNPTENSIFDITGIEAFTNIVELNFDGNSISTLNISSLLKLKRLRCRSNQLTSLDFTGLQDLESLNCSSNQITTLDFTNNPSFYDLGCANNPLLTSLILKNGKRQNTGIGIMQCDGFYITPNLTFICVDENEAEAVQQMIANFSGSTAIVNSYCSFEPGGNYNTIKGTVLFDTNNDGCDASDMPQSNIKININDGTNQGATYINDNGEYKFYTQAGSFVITPAIENSAWYNFSPSNATIPFADSNNNNSTQNFCITANGVHPDVEIVIAPYGNARPGFDATYQIVYKNKGNQLLSGDVNFTYDDTVLDFVSATVLPDAQSTGSLNWNYSNLRPFENRTIYVTLNLNSPMETPAVNSGDILNFTASVNPISGDELPADNVFGFQQTVVNSYDPNIKQCVEGNVVSSSEIGGYLHYIIDFENIGTTEAENIVVKDIIDTTMFDIKTLQIMNSSHAVEVNQKGNVVEFVFKGIKLPAGGHGNILLKIKTKSDLEVGDEVSNKAEIFFDYNFPIETNTARTTFQSLGTNDYAIDQSVSIYPNPSKGNVLVQANGIIKSLQLFDIQGRVLETRATNEKELNVDISKYSNGVYFLKVLTDVGIKTEKLIKN